jgi:NADH dehydrogenase/NADH:ubiquinone oxidoreductase subunit G
MDGKTNDPSLCFTGRGFMSIISEPLDYSFNDISGKDIDKAIDICPTGALTRKEG